MTFLTLATLTGVGLLAGFAGGLFGIGGGVIIVPALYDAFRRMDLADDLAIKLALGTSIATIIVTSARSVLRHHRHGNVEWPILRSWAPFIGVGAVVGAFLARVTDGEVLTGFFAIGLIAMGAQRWRQSGRGKPDKRRARLPAPSRQRAVAGVTGLVSSLLGIGGGVIGVLILTAAGRTTHRAVGTAAGFGLAIAVPGAAAYILAGWGETANPGDVGFVSLPAFAAISLGTFVAAPWGATAAASLSETLLTRVFSAYAALTGARMLWDAVA